MAVTSTAPPRTSGHLLSLADPEAVLILRKLFATADYSSDAIRKTLIADSAEAAIPYSDIPLLDRNMPRDGLLPTLIRLFLLSMTMDPTVLAREMKPLAPERLEALGLISLGPRGAEAIVRFHPFQSMVVVSDRNYPDPTQVPSDYVIGNNPTSVSLASVTSRRPAKAALDLGTGCGVLSLMIAGNCGRVVATDINPRALNFTAFNAFLNGVANIECRKGSLFEPVAGEKFDLIVSNPPFAVSPDSDYQFRDSGRPLDTFCGTLVRALPEHLNEGGYAAVLSNWALRTGEHWSDPARRWISGSGCDAILFHTYTETPLGYAGTWNRPLSAVQPATYEAAMDRWVEHFHRCGVESLAAGGLVLRRRTGGDNWVDTYDVPTARDPNCGEHIHQMLEARDWLSGPITEADFMRASFRPAEDVKLQQDLLVRDGRFIPPEIWASKTGGFRFRGQIDQTTWAVISLCEGGLNVGGIVEKLSRDSNTAVEVVRPKVVELVKRLYSLAYLVRV